MLWEPGLYLSSTTASSTIVLGLLYPFASDYKYLSIVQYQVAVGCASESRDEVRKSVQNLSQPASPQSNSEPCVSDKYSFGCARRRLVHPFSTFVVNLKMHFCIDYGHDISRKTFDNKMSSV
jgi:hypothetical protein